MSAITAQAVKELREKTGAGMMDCKAALKESNGDMNEAIENLRKKGLKAASKKADRIACEGRVTTVISSDGKKGVILETNCETDFVAKNDDFINFSNQIAELILDKNPSNIDELNDLEIESGSTVTDRINLLTSKIGEKLTIRRFNLISSADNESLGSYIHMGDKIGVLLNVKGNVDQDLIKDVAMHIAAINPRYLSKDQISADEIEKEKDIYREQLKAEGKPDDIIEKIIIGKINKFSSEVCLNDQVFIKDPTGKKSVSNSLKEADKEAQVSQFIRYMVGEGMEKRQDDFASEVSKIANA